MTYNELKTAMSNWNATYYTRFTVRGDELSITGNSNRFKFTENDYGKVLEVVDKYGYLKPDSECYALELYLKGLKWDNLTDKQKESTYCRYIGKYYIPDDPNFYDNNKNIQSYWNNDRDAFLKWSFENNKCPLQF